MDTYIFPHIGDFRGQIGKAVSVNFDLNDTGPTILAAAESYILPWIGAELWEELVAAVDANSLTPAQDALLPYVQRSLAHFTMYEYIATGEILVSDAGVFRQENEERKTAYKSQVNNYRKYMLVTGYAALESMLKYLQANASDFPNWTSNPASKRNREAFINYASDFQLVYSININRYVMETLRGLMLDLEQFAILPLLGDEFFTELKTAIDADTVTAAQQQVITLVQSAVAHFTVEEGLRRNIVQNTGIAIVSTETLEPQGNYRQGTPNSNNLRLSIQHHDEFANRHVSRLLRFLRANIDDYPTYKAFVESEEAAAEEAAQEANTITAYDRDGCATTSPTRQNVIRW